jgi:hypothetical protein
MWKLDETLRSSPVRNGADDDDADDHACTSSVRQSMVQ